MDGDGDGSISVSELERALVRASNNGLKLVDVFAALDTSGDGLIDANELRDGLAQLAAPGGIASQVARRKREARMRETSESTGGRIKMFGYVSISVLLLLSFWQTVYLKSFFRSKKLL